jgi:hypothetical protein
VPNLEAAVAQSSEAWDFFLAHAGDDRDRAGVLYDLLSRQARVFLDFRALKLGDDWDAALARAQKNSRITVVLVSASTDRAYYQREEIAGAIAMARENQTAHRVVPVYLDGLTPENSDLPYGLRLKHGLVVKEGDTLSAAADQLLHVLAQETGRRFDPVDTVGRNAASGTTKDSGADGWTLSDAATVSQSSTSRIVRGHHPVHGSVLIKDLLEVPDESVDLVQSRHYRVLLGKRVIEISRREDGQLHEILQDIPGDDLWTVVNKGNVIVGALLDDIALQVLEQLAAAHGHAKPVIHRDVRPTNLILRFEPLRAADGVLKADSEGVYRAVVQLIDYDTACFQNDSQTPWGALGFTSPEQRKGQAVPASDLFSLVSSLYFLATGTVPPDASAWPNQEPPAFDTLFRADFTRLSELYGHEALLRCWSYDVKKRPVSAAAFLAHTRRRGTRAFREPARLGAFHIEGRWRVELFDSEYQVRPAL